MILLDTTGEGIELVRALALMDDIGIAGTNVGLR